MKNFLPIIFATLISVSSLAQKNHDNDIIECDIEMVNGVIPFTPAYSLVSTHDTFTGTPWEKTRVEVKGLPESWKDPVVQMIQFDVIQFLYQNYKQGKINEQFYNMFRQQLPRSIKESKLSEKPIKCFSHIAINKLENGEISYRIDTNNNLDFSDEQTFKPKEFPDTTLKAIDSLSKKCHWIDGEIFFNNEVKKIKYPFMILKNPNGSLVYNFPQYAKTDYKGKTILVSSGFTQPSFFSHSAFTIVDSDVKTGNIDKIDIGEYFKINNQIYQNIGVDFSAQKLKFKKIDTTSSSITSTQLGFQAKSILGKDFISGESIDLDDYKGKYLYLEFWGTWCGPCVQEVPKLKSIYQKLDKSKIEFLGIVRDSPEGLKEFIDQKHIPWKQILSTPKNNIVKEYKISSFPSSFLINEEGKIVAKNLRADILSEKLKKFEK